MALEEAFERLCQPVLKEGLKAATVTDKDGVIILKSVSQDAPANLEESRLPTTFAIANNQASKLGLKQNQCILSMYDQYQIVQLDHNPLIITLIGDATANTGLLMNLGQEIIKITQSLATVLKDKQKEAA